MGVPVAAPAVQRCSDGGLPQLCVHGACAQAAVQYQTRRRFHQRRRAFKIDKATGHHQARGGSGRSQSMPVDGLR